MSRSPAVAAAEAANIVQAVVPRLQLVVILSCMNTTLGPCLHIRQDDGHSGLILLQNASSSQQSQSPLPYCIAHGQGALHMRCMRNLATSTSSSMLRSVTGTHRRR